MNGIKSLHQIDIPNKFYSYDWTSTYKYVAIHNNLTP